MKTLPYTIKESEAAHAEWAASCGHHSIAAAAGVSLESVRRACHKLCGWMSPIMIDRTLQQLGINSRVVIRGKFHGSPTCKKNETWVYRVQFEGSWLKPGVPIGAAYQRTHYIALLGGFVMDTMRHPNVLTTADEWLNLQTEHVGRVKGATGWHFTHLWLVKFSK